MLWKEEEALTAEGEARKLGVGGGGGGGRKGGGGGGGEGGEGGEGKYSH